MKNIRRKAQRKPENLGHFVGLRPEAEAPLHGAGLGVTDAQHDAPKTHRPIHGFQNDAQNVIELETVDQRIADVLNAGRQYRLGIDLPARLA